MCYIVGATTISITAFKKTTLNIIIKNATQAMTPASSISILSVFILSYHGFVMLNVIFLSVFIPSVTMLRVVAPDSVIILLSDIYCLASLKLSWRQNIIGFACSL